MNKELRNNLEKLTNNKISVGILGATGMVGQKYLELLEKHPWFEVCLLAASSRSENKTYEEAVSNRWQMAKPIPKKIKNQKIISVDRLLEKVQTNNEGFLENFLTEGQSIKNVKILFSCFEMSDKDLIKKYENEFAKLGFMVISNASANRWEKDIPMLLPEINSQHLQILDLQRKNRSFKDGCIVVKPNCSLQSYLTPIFALEKKGFQVEKVVITSLQAVSGAGYPGVASLDMIDNLVPFIDGEEKKSEMEPLKILGQISENGFKIRTGLEISATCIRVPITDGHTASVSLKFKNKKPSLQEIKNIWKNFTSLPQELKLPSAPIRPIWLLEDDNRPQPKKDRDNDKGMAVSVGRIRECQSFDLKFVALSHNTIRGAAGGGVLNAEMLVASNQY